jgi:4-diphosphocytidyl-2-C-methyl-D-erythritol kinase
MFEDQPRAKVNLTLKVTGRRPDGYHELRSVFLRIGLSDRLSVAPGGADGSDALTVTGLEDVPTRANLVIRAIEAVRARAEIPLPALSVTLEKLIPVAAGLGGGSSNCASAIKLAQTCWGIGLSEAEEIELGASLGSDVPFFLSEAEMALVEGRGERVTALRPMGQAAVLTATPRIELSTARVFDRYDQVGGMPVADMTTDLLEFPDLASAASRLRDSNDLWPAAAALAPGLEEVRDSLETATIRPWLMSGSGPTLFAIYPSVAEASEAGRALVAVRSAVMSDVQMYAVDLVGPVPEWRYP